MEKHASPRTAVLEECRCLEGVDRGNLHPSKSDRMREATLPVSVEGRKVLYRFLQKHEFPRIFCTRTGSKRGRRDMLRDLKRLCR
jgi:hypothetical protein